MTEPEIIEALCSPMGKADLANASPAITTEAKAQNEPQRSWLRALIALFGWRSKALSPATLSPSIDAARRRVGISAAVRQAELFGRRTR
jgi:hypothetical protein